jgi:hypothetical protein
MTMTTIYATPDGLDRLQDRVQKHASKARKLGQPAPTIQTQVITVIPVVDGLFDHWSQYSFYRVTVSGTVPHINGWTPVARVEPVQGGTMVHLAPGVDAVDPRWREWGNTCEHCRTKRRRTDLVVLRHDDGREMAVGRKCLADFLGAEGAEVSVDWWFKPIQFGDDDYLGGMGSVLPTPAQAIAHASAVIRAIGYVSKAAAERDGVLPTSHPVQLFLRDQEQFQRQYGRVQVDDHDMQTASEVLGWCLSQRDSTSDYLRNLALICSQDFVAWKHLAYVVSSIPAWQRAMAEKMERAATNEKPKEWIEQDKVKGLRATIRRATVNDGYYGTTTIISMIAEDEGQQYPLVWFASGTHDWRPGEQVEVSGTVKDRRDDDRYGKQTILTRCRLVEVDAQ